MAPTLDVPFLLSSPSRWKQTSQSKDLDSSAKSLIRRDWLNAFNYQSVSEKKEGNQKEGNQPNYKSNTKAKQPDKLDTLREVVKKSKRTYKTIISNKLI